MELGNRNPRRPTGPADPPVHPDHWGVRVPSDPLYYAADLPIAAVDHEDVSAGMETSIAD